MDEFGFLILFGLLIVFVPPVLAIWAMVRASDVRTRLNDVLGRMAALEREVARLRHSSAPRAEAAESHESATVTAPPLSEPEPERKPDPDPEPEPEPETKPADAPFVDETETARPVVGDFGQRFAESWLIWVGGLALALGGAFLVKYSIDQGWLTPALRCAMAGLLGLGLLVLGERVRRRASPEAQGVPVRRAAAALTAAGLSSLFAGLFAAHALYDLIGAPVAFIGLGVVSLAGVAMALLHGPFVAVLGLLGGYAVPLLVSSEDPAPIPLFLYLFALTGAAALLPRWRPWPWLGMLALVGNTLWVWLVMAFSMEPGDEGVLAVFLLAMAGVFTLVRVGLPVGVWEALSAPRTDGETRNLTEVAWVLASGLLVLLALVSDQAPATVAALLALTALGLWAGARDARLWVAPVAPVLAGLLTLAGWDLVGTPLPEPDALLNPPLPKSGTAFLVLAVGQGALVALGAYLLAARRASRPMAWAGLATVTPLLILAVTFWRFSEAGLDLAWAALALGLGGLSLLAAWRMAGVGAGAGGQPQSPLGAYAVGVLAAVALAAAFALEQAWLTVALAVILPAVAWVEGRLGDRHVPGLRGAALVMAVVVLVRLAANPYVLSYPLSDSGVLSWLFYGYGLPALAFGLAARWFLARRDGLLVTVLEGGAIAFAVLLVSLSIRHGLAGPGLAGGPLVAAEWAAHIGAWLIGAVLLQAWRGSSAHADRPVVRWAEGLLGAGAGLALLVGPVTGANPLVTGAPVGAAPVFNLLLALYASPALLLGWWAVRAPEGGRIRRLAAPGAVALLGLWLTLCVRQAFTGPILSGPAPGEAELYAYSVLWLLFGVALLLTGARLTQAAARRAGLLIVLAVTLKVFLIDMAALTGLWRVLSFLGLGAALIGLGALTRALEHQGRGGKTDPR